MNEVILKEILDGMCNDINEIVDKKVGSALYDECMEIVDVLNDMLEKKTSKWLIEEDSNGDVYICEVI